MAAAIYVDDDREPTRAGSCCCRSAESDELGAGAGPRHPVPGTITVVAVTPTRPGRCGRPAGGGVEAMKMEHRIVADMDAEVVDVRVEEGRQCGGPHQVVVTLAATDRDTDE